MSKQVSTEQGNCQYCGYFTKTPCNLKRHLSVVHDIGVKWVYCDHDGCDFKSKRKDHMKQHKADRHNIDVRLFNCTHDGCTYTCKQKSSLKTHLASKHRIGVVWNHCTVPNCEFKCVHKSNLTKHMKTKHRGTNSWWYHGNVITNLTYNTLTTWKEVLYFNSEPPILNFPRSTLLAKLKYEPTSQRFLSLPLGLNIVFIDDICPPSRAAFFMHLLWTHK